MILPVHNAHLTQVKSVGSPADPVLGITGAGDVPKWIGDAHAEIKDSTVQEVRGDQRFLVRQLIVDLPANLPVTVAENDLLSLRKITTGESLVVQVRSRDETFWGMGKFRFICRYQ